MGNLSHLVQFVCFYLSVLFLLYLFLISATHLASHFHGQHKFVFWYTRRTPGVRSQTSYEDNIKKIVDFSTVIFIVFYKRLQRAQSVCVNLLAEYCQTHRLKLFGSAIAIWLVHHLYQAQLICIFLRREFVLCGR